MILKPVKLPCLRCGCWEVRLLARLGSGEWRSSETPCERCGALHYLVLKNGPTEKVVAYDRYTLRYPINHYDPGSFPTIQLRRAELLKPDDDDSLYGPIIVYKRKRFTAGEVKQIWLASQRSCHLCGKRWKLGERSRHGWHIDHEIPNIGGGKETEELENFKVACARCNLKKGRGHTPRMIRQALGQLFV